MLTFFYLMNWIFGKLVTNVMMINTFFYYENVKNNAMDCFF